MKNEIKKVITADIFILLFVLIFGIAIFSVNINDITAFLGAGFLLVAIINSVLGFASLLVGLANQNSETRRYAVLHFFVASRFAAWRISVSKHNS